jgi:hypothetical protein
MHRAVHGPVVLKKTPVQIIAETVSLTASGNLDPQGAI